MIWVDISIIEYNATDANTPMGASLAAWVPRNHLSASVIICCCVFRTFQLRACQLISITNMHEPSTPWIEEAILFCLCFFVLSNQCVHMHVRIVL